MNVRMTVTMGKCISEEVPQQQQTNNLYLVLYLVVETIFLRKYNKYLE